MGPRHRRSFLLAVPHAALAGACAFGIARVRTSPQAVATTRLDTSCDPQTPAAPDPPSSSPPAPATRRTQPLPMPSDAEVDRTWLQEWLDLTSLTSKRTGTGC